MPEGWNVLLGEELAPVLWRVLSELPVDPREVLELVFVEGFGVSFVRGMVLDCIPGHLVEERAEWWEKLAVIGEELEQRVREKAKKWD